ncbi:MAG: glycosyltransferase family 2 protein [Bacteroides sp.]|nr:glycosyltransferase family 2 protein [Eubacterium sp.]MCM1418501.1 glycosyltransferase family 2 protein [Roseburia sp.]MCM1462520.1 glycosyltransferase family 2 protein [Bacteroides sp.]
MVSVIIPAYNEEENIAHTAEVVGGILKKAAIPYELLFVDDGSRDATWERIARLAAEDGAIRGLRFSRNFGKEGAIFAGLSACVGDAAVCIDCDLQHPPELIPKMVALWEEGYEVVEAVKADRGKEGFLYRFFAKGFYRIMKNSSDVNLDRASDFKLLDRKAIDALGEMPERLTFFRALSSWIGFRTAQVEFTVAPRNAGETKWSFKKLFRFALNNITSFTNLPLQLVTGAGVIFLAIAVVFGVQTLVNYFSGTAREGFSTVILLILLTGSFLMLGLGVIGYYMAKIYEEIKFRPRYIVAEDTSSDKNKNKKENKGKEEA